MGRKSERWNENDERSFHFYLFPGARRSVGGHGEHPAAVSMEPAVEAVADDARLGVRCIPRTMAGDHWPRLDALSVCRRGWGALFLLAADPRGSRSAQGSSVPEVASGTGGGHGDSGALAGV